MVDSVVTLVEDSIDQGSTCFCGNWYQMGHCLQKVKKIIYYDHEFQLLIVAQLVALV